MKFTPSKQVKDAINNNKPILALESTIIASGMPYPQNKDFYNRAVETCCRLDVVLAAIATGQKDHYEGYESFNDEE